MKRKICKWSDAKKAGHPRYFTGVPCKHGHIAERLVRDGSCIECRRGWRAAFHASARESQNAKRAERYQQNRADELARNARYNDENLAKRTATQNKRMAKRISAMPRWFGEFDEFVMDHAHELARMRHDATGVDWNVDHMIPLQAKSASGLHVGMNVQVIPQALNAMKLNRMVMTEPGQWVGYLLRR